MGALALAQSILVFVGIVAIGALLRAFGVLRASETKALNAVVVYVGLPAFIFRAVHGAVLTPSILRVVALAWAVFAIVLGVAWLVGRALRVSRPVLGGLLLTAALGNTGYIGYPMTSALLGNRALPEAVFYDVFGTVFALALVGTYIAQRYGTRGGKAPNPLRELLTFPAVPALALGLALRPVPIPAAVSHGLDLLAAMVAPLVMIAVGASLRPGAVAKFAVPLIGVAALRLALSPALAVALGGAVLAGPALRVAVLEASMPAMMLTLVIGDRFELDRDFIASAIFVTTALSALTIPLWQALAFR